MKRVWSLVQRPSRAANALTPLFAPPTSSLSPLIKLNSLNAKYAGRTRPWCSARASPRCPNFSLAQRPAPDWEMLAVRPSFCHEIESSRGCPHACAYCAYPNRANQPMMTRPIGDVAAELRRLRKENARLVIEREILKKAAAFFAREQS